MVTPRCETCEQHCRCLDCISQGGRVHPDLCRMLAVAGAILTALLLVVR